MEYGAAKRKAARDARPHGRARPSCPATSRSKTRCASYIELFCADTQPAELRALREVALRGCSGWPSSARTWPARSGAAPPRGCRRPHRPVLRRPQGGRDRADQPGLDYDVGSRRPPAAASRDVLSVASLAAALGEPVTLHLSVRDHDDQRGALKPDARGRSWRGDLAALQRLLAGRDRHEAAPAGCSAAAGAAAGAGRRRAGTAWQRARRAGAAAGADRRRPVEPALRRGPRAASWSMASAARPAAADQLLGHLVPALRQGNARARPLPARVAAARLAGASAWPSTARRRCGSSWRSSRWALPSAWPASTAPTWRAAGQRAAAACPSRCCSTRAGAVVQRKLGETSFDELARLGAARDGSEAAAFRGQSADICSLMPSR